MKTQESLEGKPLVSQGLSRVLDDVKTSRIKPLMSLDEDGKSVHREPLTSVDHSTDEPIMTQINRSDIGTNPRLYMIA